MTDESVLGGLHHVTAIAGPPEANLAFYTGTLGLRLVKKTVNFDDPGTYHLYYGDEEGRPGSILTFFPWRHAARGRTGIGMVAATSFEAPPGSIDAWSERLPGGGASVVGRGERFGQEVLSFVDPDGLPLEIVAPDGAGDVRGDEPEITGAFHSVTLNVEPVDPTARLLGDVLGYRLEKESDERLRFRSPRARRAAVVDLLKSGTRSRGRSGAGVVHHIAFRVGSEEEQLAWKERLEAAGRQVTPVRDRQYFKSIYFREPGGVLFEIATDPPGFTLDESIQELGTSLKLPPWLEPHRGRIEGQLDELSSPLS